MMSESLADGFRELDWPEIRKFLRSLSWALVKIRALKDEELATAREIAHKYENVPSAILDNISRTPKGDMKGDMGLDCAADKLDLTVLKLLSEVFKSIASLDEKILPKVRLVADTYHNAPTPHWLDPKNTPKILAEISKRAHHHNIDAIVDEIENRAGIV